MSHTGNNVSILTEPRPCCALGGGSVSGKRAASELGHLLFPHCARVCSAVEYFGVCECEAICPQKFNLFDGTPKTQNVPAQPRDL